MNKTLIIYGTRKGTTTETVRVIAEILRADYSHVVDIYDSRQIKYFKKRINEFDNIIIGSSIVSGLWKSSVLSIVKRDLFKGKKVAVFVTAGGTLNKVSKYGISKEEATNEAITNYIDKYLKKFRFVPVSKGAFGGKVIKKDKIKYNSWNKEDIINWTIDLGKRINETTECESPDKSHIPG
jgi:menaquinone-dependent protoporphyrinogen IX oxidase